MAPRVEAVISYLERGGDKAIITDRPTSAGRWLGRRVRRNLDD